MTAVFLGTLFTISALLAAGTIAATCRRYLRPALALRGELTACDDRREACWTIRETRVGATATVLRPDFTPRPAARRALPAAA